MRLRFPMLLLPILIFLNTISAATAAEFRVGLIMAETYRNQVEDQVLNHTIEAFLKSRRFSMVERDQLDAVIKEKGLQEFIGALTSGDASSGLEKLNGIDMIGLVNYSIEQDPETRVRTYWINVRLVNVETGNIAATVDSRRHGLDEPTTPYIASGYLFENLRQQFPPEGNIVKVKGSEVIVDLGTDVGIQKGDVLEIIEQGETLFGIDGRPLVGEETVLGQLKVLRVAVDVSTCKTKGHAEAAYGAIVRLKPSNQQAYEAVDRAHRIKRFGRRIKGWVKD